MSKANEIATKFRTEMAREAARLFLNNQCDSRDLDDCFENGSGESIERELIAMVRADPLLAKAVRRNARYAGKAMLAAAGVEVAA